MALMTTHRRTQRHAGTGPRNHHWPLLLIAAPAAVAIWSGWVGLGGMAGFGIVHPLPGIFPAVRINTAITLPVGVEAYGAYALWVWLSGRGSERTLAFARRSALGALGLGCLGQVIFHLLTAANWAVAPWPVVVAVACLPVVTLSFAATLVHLTRADVAAAERAAAEAEQAKAEAAALAEARAAARAAVPPRNRAGSSGGSRKRKPAGTAKRNRAAEPVAEPVAEPAPPASPEPDAGLAPEPAAEETVGIDAEARILQLIAEGHTPSKAGILAGASDSYGRKVARTAKKLTEAAPEGRDAKPVAVAAFNGHGPEDPQ